MLRAAGACRHLNQQPEFTLLRFIITPLFFVAYVPRIQKSAGMLLHTGSNAEPDLRAAAPGGPYPPWQPAPWKGGRPRYVVPIIPPPRPQVKAAKSRKKQGGEALWLRRPGQALKRPASAYHSWQTWSYISTCLAALAFQLKSQAMARRTSCIQPSWFWYPSLARQQVCSMSWAL